MVDRQVLTNEILDACQSSEIRVINWRAYILLSLAVAAVWLIVRLAVLSILGPPAPLITDEFSYLLGGDTFAHGRLTNPPHLLAPFFASPHILVEPTYSSKYPPGQALFLAAGQVLFRSPFSGIVLEGVLMMFLLCLMLCIWTTTLWPATIVSAALIIFFQPPMYWVDSYWGGCLAVSGGALLLIALGWYRISSNPISGCVFAAGGVVLFVTRPYEGGITFLIMLVILALKGVIALERGERRKLILAAAYGIPIAMTAAAGILTHNSAVTGNPFVLPYQLHSRAYDVASIFWFLPMRQTDPAYPNPRLREMFGRDGWEGREYRKARTIRHGYAGHLLIAAAVVLLDVLPPLPFLLFAIGLIGGIDWIDRRVWVCLVLIGAGVFASSLELWQQPHYTAPSVPAIVLLWGILVERAISIRVRKLPVGPIAVGLIFLVAFAPSIEATELDCRNMYTRMLLWRYERPVMIRRWQPTDLRTKRVDWPLKRIELIRRLSATEKPSLVIVRYPSPSWGVGPVEWVYNGADIDHQPVIFAHDLGTSKNLELLNYYRDRTVWLLTFDPNNLATYFLNPYPR